MLFLWIVHCSFTIVSFPNCLLSCKMQPHFNQFKQLLYDFLKYGNFYQLLIIIVLSGAVVLPRSCFYACISDVLCD